MRAPVWVSAVGTCTRGRVVVRVRVSPAARDGRRGPPPDAVPRPSQRGPCHPPSWTPPSARPAIGHRAAAGRHPLAQRRPSDGGTVVGRRRNRRRREVRAARRRADVVEGVGHEARRSVGGATSARIWVITCSTVIPANWASAVRSRRWLSTGCGEHLDVVGHHVVAALADRPGLRAAHEREAAAHRQAEPDADVPPGLLGEPRDVVEDRGVDVHLVGERGHVGDHGRGDHRLQAAGCGRGSWRRAAPAPWRRGRGSRARSSSGSGRAGPRAAGRCRPARWGSGWRSP